MYPHNFFDRTRVSTYHGEENLEEREFECFLSNEDHDKNQYLIYDAVGTEELYFEELYE